MSLGSQLQELFYGPFGPVEVDAASGIAHIFHLRRLYFEQTVIPRVNRILSDSSIGENADDMTSFVVDYFRIAFDVLYGHRSPAIASWRDHQCCTPIETAESFYFVKKNPIMDPILLTIRDVRFRFQLKGMDGANELPWRLSYSFAGVEDGTIFVDVLRSRRAWTKSKLRQLARDMTAAGVTVSSEDLRHAIKTFERLQSTDYFLAKNPRQLLTTLFEEWLLNLALHDELEIDTEHVRFLRNTVHSIIDLIARFEQDLP